MQHLSALQGDELEVRDEPLVFLARQASQQTVLQRPPALDRR